MSKLSPEQAALKASIQKSALIWAVILGAIIGGLAYMLTSSTAQPMRSLIAGGAFVVIAGLIFTWRSKANADAATCPKCNATFSITRTDRKEVVALTEPKETRDAQPDHSTKVTTWVEETIAVTDTYTCAKCGDTTVKKYNRTKKRDEKEVIEPAPEKGKPAPEPGVATSSKSAPATKGGSSSAAKEATPPAKGVSKKGKS